MLSKSRISFINSLKIKKYREIHKQFIAEGSKLVKDLNSSSFVIKEIYATSKGINDLNQNTIKESIPVQVVDEREMKKITCLSTNSPVLALVEIPEYQPDFLNLNSELILILDDIRDPGNMGTIIRIADWFGIRTLICSENTVDLYNPKVVQATMGSIARVNVFYTSLNLYLEKLSSEITVYGAFLTGENIYRKELRKNGIIIIGNEANGISKEIEKYVTERLYIPSFNDWRNFDDRAESLNVSVAAAIVCSEFRRSNF